MPYRKKRRMGGRKKGSFRRKKRFGRKKGGQMSRRTMSLRYSPSPRTHRFLPENFFNKMYYKNAFAAVLGLTGAGDGNTFIRVTWNAMFDLIPNSIVAQTPYGFTTMTELYDNWIVLGAKITFSCWQVDLAANQNILAAIIPRHDETGPGSFLAKYLEMPGTKSKVVLERSVKPIVLSTYIKTKDMLGKSNVVDDPELWGSGTVNPIEVGQCILGLGSTEVLDTSVIVEGFVEVEFYVKWSGLAVFTSTQEDVMEITNLITPIAQKIQHKVVRSKRRSLAERRQYGIHPSGIGSPTIIEDMGIEEMKVDDSHRVIHRPKVVHVSPQHKQPLRRQDAMVF